MYVMPEGRKAYAFGRMNTTNAHLSNQTRVLFWQDALNKDALLA
jgi:hypothetical protein